MTTPFKDAFTDAGTNVDLAAHTPTGGTAWTRITAGGGAAGDLRIPTGANLCQNNTTANPGALYLCDDQGVSWHYNKFTIQGSPSAFVALHSTDQSNYLGFRYSGGQLQLYAKVAGSFVQLKAVNVTASNGDLVEVYHDDFGQVKAYLTHASVRSLVFTYHDTIQWATTRQGLAASSSGAVNWLDDYEAGPTDRYTGLRAYDARLSTALLSLFGQKVTFGTILQYAKTNSWTVLAGFCKNGNPVDYGGGIGASIIYSNVVGASAYTGHEVWIGPTGVLRVRLISNIATLDYMARVGTTVVTDGNWHWGGYTYDGSNTTGGIQAWLDGAKETTTQEAGSQASLTGDMTGSGNFMIGNQVAGSDNFFSFNGVIGFVCIFPSKMSDAYMAAITSSALPKPSDAACDLYVPFDEGSGTTARDRSGNGRNGTLISASMWVYPNIRPRTLRSGRGIMSGRR